MFTHYGLSGPAVFDLSPFLVRDPGEEWIAMDFFPDQTSEDLDAKIREIWSNNPGRTLGNSLIGILPKKFAQVLVRNVLGADIGTPVADVGKETRRKLVAMLKHLTVKLKGPRGWDEAQATAGGILTDEIDPRTMESNKCPGLYFCGEVLDIDGDCGGYNLQFAFSSGFAAGTAAAKVLSG
jgi:predicted Rossmann fold flavoprotein